MSNLQPSGTKEGNAKLETEKPGTETKERKTLELQPLTKKDDAILPEGSQNEVQPGKSRLKKSKLSPSSVESVDSSYVKFEDRNVKNLPDSGKNKKSKRTRMNKKIGARTGQVNEAEENEGSKEEFPIEGKRQKPPDQPERNKSGMVENETDVVEGNEAPDIKELSKGKQRDTLKRSDPVKVMDTEEVNTQQGNVDQKDKMPSKGKGRKPPKGPLKKKVEGVKKDKDAKEDILNEGRPGKAAKRTMPAIRKNNEATKKEGLCHEDEEKSDDEQVAEADGHEVVEVESDGAQGEDEDDEQYDPFREQTHCQKFFYCYALLGIFLLLIGLIIFFHHLHVRIQLYGFWDGILFRQPTNVTTSPALTTTERPKSSASYHGISQYLLCLLIATLVTFRKQH